MHGGRESIFLLILASGIVKMDGFSAQLAVCRMEGGNDPICHRKKSQGALIRVSHVVARQAGTPQGRESTSIHFPPNKSAHTQNM